MMPEGIFPARGGGGFEEDVAHAKGHACACKGPNLRIHERIMITKEQCSKEHVIAVTTEDTMPGVANEEIALNDQIETLPAWATFQSSPTGPSHAGFDAAVCGGGKPLGTQRLHS